MGDKPTNPGHALYEVPKDFRRSTNQRDAQSGSGGKTGDVGACSPDVAGARCSGPLWAECERAEREAGRRAVKLWGAFLVGLAIGQLAHCERDREPSAPSPVTALSFLRTHGPAHRADVRRRDGRGD